MERGRKRQVGLWYFYICAGDLNSTAVHRGLGATSRIGGRNVE